MFWSTRKVEQLKEFLKQYLDSQKSDALRELQHKLAKVHVDLSRRGVFTSSIAVGSFVSETNAALELFVEVCSITCAGVMRGQGLLSNEDVRKYAVSYIKQMALELTNPAEEKLDLINKNSSMDISWGKKGLTDGAERISMKAEIKLLQAALTEDKYVRIHKWAAVAIPLAALIWAIVEFVLK